MRHTTLAMSLVLMTTLLVGCTHSVHLNHTSDFKTSAPLTQAKVVESVGAQDAFLGMFGETDYVDEAYADLMNQCPDGEITGIQTRYSTSHGFFHWTNTVVMQGYCLQP